MAVEPGAIVRVKSEEVLADSSDVRPPPDQP
jgi:hypothetical protein